MDFIGGYQNKVLNTSVFERSIPNLIIFNFSHATTLVYRGLHNATADTNNYIVPVNKNLIIHGIRLIGTIDASALCIFQIGSGTTSSNTSTPPTTPVTNLSIQLYLLQTGMLDLKFDARTRIDSSLFPYVRATVSGASISGQLYCTLEDN